MKKLIESIKKINYNKYIDFYSIYKYTSKIEDKDTEYCIVLDCEGFMYLEKANDYKPYICPDCLNRWEVIYKGTKNTILDQFKKDILHYKYELL